ncbi:SWIM zinc finger family protein [Methanoregula sp.]|uniref:SWIM zinc finger family protein n=1 Tax=Methanoregula sp. TaxID=2052170 RepID=UPI003BB13D0E
MKDLWQQLCEKKVLDDALRVGIVAEYGSRGAKALDAIDRHLIKKYLDFFVVAGSTGEHVVSENVCTCRDFAFRQKLCWHLIAVRIAEATGTFETINAWYQDSWKNKST